MSQRKDDPYQKTYSRRDLFRVLTGRGRRQDAITPAKSAVTPTDAADRLFQAGDHAGAARAYRAFLDQHPDHRPVRRRLVTSLYHQRDLDGAAREVEVLLREQERDSFGRLYLGLIRARMGDRAGAVAAWKGYFNVDQPLIQREINLCLAREEIGQPIPAEELVQEVEAAMERQARNDAGQG